MYGENLGTGTLTESLEWLARVIRDRRDNGFPTTENDIKACRYLMEGSRVLWERLMKEMHE